MQWNCNSATNTRCSLIKWGRWTNYELSFLFYNSRYLIGTFLFFFWVIGVPDPLPLINSIGGLLSMYCMLSILKATWLTFPVFLLAPQYGRCHHPHCMDKRRLSSFWIPVLYIPYSHSSAPGARRTVSKGWIPLFYFRLAVFVLQYGNRI